MEKICYIVCAGENCGLGFRPREGDYVIAADAGLRYLEAEGIHADMVIGDFDTLGFCPEHENVVRLNTIKDDTDTFAAVREGEKRGFSLFHIYCGMAGKRIEHTLANFQLLVYLAEKGKQGILFDDRNAATAIKNGKMDFPAGQSGMLSVFSNTDISEGVEETGLKYLLHDATLTNAFPLGVSNEFTSQAASISVKNGTLIVIYPKSVKGVNITRLT